MSAVQKIDSEVLKKLGEEVDAFRIPGRKLQLPNDLKVRICKHWRDGVSLAVLRKVTGITDTRIRIWSKKIDTAQSKKSFRVFQVENNTDNRISIPSQFQKQQPNNSQAPLLFRYADGRAVLEIQAAQLTPELMRILALC